MKIEKTELRITREKKSIPKLGKRNEN